MLYDIAHFWVALLVAVVLGVGVGWFTLSDKPRHGPIFRIGRGCIFWSGVLFIVGLMLALIHALPDRPGLWLETALLLFVGYIVGCPIPGLRSATAAGRGSAASVRSDAVASPPFPAGAARSSTPSVGSIGNADSRIEAGRVGPMPATAPASVSPTQTRPTVGQPDEALRSSATPSDSPAATSGVLSPPPVFRPVGTDGETGSRGPTPANAVGASGMPSDLPIVPSEMLRPPATPPAVGPTDHHTARDQPGLTDDARPEGDAERRSLLPPVPVIPSVGVRPVRKRAAVDAVEKADDTSAAAPTAPPAQSIQDGRLPEALPDVGAPVDDAATENGNRGPAGDIDRSDTTPAVSPLASIGVRPTRKRAVAGAADKQGATDRAAPTGTIVPPDKAGRRSKTPSKPKGRTTGIISDDPDAVDKPKS